MDEAWAAQLKNGSVIVFMRNCELANFHDCQMISEPLLNNPHPSDPPALLRAGGPGNHRVAYALSSDGGITFGPIRNHPDLLTPVCQASAVEYKGSLYFAGPHSTTARMNMTVLASDDSECRQASIFCGFAAFSSGLLNYGMSWLGPLSIFKQVTKVGNANRRFTSWLQMRRASHGSYGSPMGRRATRPSPAAWRGRSTARSPTTTTMTTRSRGAR